jgi:hypothetical protein
MLLQTVLAVAPGGCWLPPRLLFRWSGGDKSKPTIDACRPLHRPEAVLRNLAQRKGISVPVGEHVAGWILAVMIILRPKDVLRLINFLHRVVRFYHRQATLSPHMELRTDF